jgi:NTP pyrophosphatase (non-canonical NTP hydrolase)
MSGRNIKDLEEIRKYDNLPEPYEGCRDDLLGEYLDGLWELGRKCFLNSYDHGFWKVKENGKIGRNFGEAIALIHSELSECLESYRKQDNVGDMDKIAVEMADVIIRLLDLAYGTGHEVHKAMYKKMNYNKTRPHKHGKLI